MMLDNQDRTTGSQFEENELQQPQSVIVEKKSYETSSKSDEEKSSKTSEIIRASKDLIKTLSEDSSFTTMFMGLVGYIIIAATGNMNNTGAEFRYLGFLILIVLSYKINKYTQFPIVINFSKENTFFKISYLLLLLLIFYTFRLQVFNLLNSLLSSLKFVNGATK